jgi:hypothetical protein
VGSRRAVEAPIGNELLHVVSATDNSFYVTLIAGSKHHSNHRHTDVSEQLVAKMGVGCGFPLLAGGPPEASRKYNKRQVEHCLELVPISPEAPIVGLTTSNAFVAKRQRLMWSSTAFNHKGVLSSRPSSNLRPGRLG